MNISTNFQGNLSTASSAPSARVPRHLAIFVVVFVAASILAGTFGNAHVCILLRRRRDLRKVPHYLLANLALTGVLSSLFSMPLLIVMTTVSYFQILDVPVVEMLCKVGFPSFFAFSALNALTLWLMAFDRQECVLRPFNRRLTKNNVKKILPVTWSFALITFVLFAISIENEPSVCTEFFPYNNRLTQHGHRKLFTTLLSVVGQFDKITIVIVIVTFLRIMKGFRSSVVSNPSNPLHQRREKRITNLTYKLCGIFLLFRVPVIICQTALPRIEGLQETATKSASLVSYAMLYLVYVTNPVVHHRMLKITPMNRGGGAGFAAVAVARQKVEPVEPAVQATGHQSASDEPHSQTTSTV